MESVGFEPTDIIKYLSMSLTDILDLLCNAATAEKVLRNQAEMEWANNIQGPMTEAHKVSIHNVVLAAKQLIEVQDNASNITDTKNSPQH